MARQCPACKAMHPDALEFCPTDGAHLADPAAPQPEVAPASLRRAPQHTVLGTPLDLHPVGASTGEERVGQDDATRAYMAMVDDPPLPMAPTTPAASPAAVGPPAPPQPPSGSLRAVARPSLARGPRNTAGISLGVVDAAPAEPVAHGRGSTPTVAPVPGPPSRSPVSEPAPTSAPAPAAAAPPATPRRQTTLQDAFLTGPWNADQAVARIALVADAVARQHAASHGLLTPRHVHYESSAPGATPSLAAAKDVPVEPLYAALYRPPELADGPGGPPADVYTLGCLVFEALTGRAPFKGASIAELHKRHATAAAPAVRMVRRDCELPPSLEIELQRALKKRPGDRHASVAELAGALRASVRDDDRHTMALNTGDVAALQALLSGAQPSAPAQGGTGPAAKATSGPVTRAAAGATAQANPRSAPEPIPVAPPTRSNAGLIAAIAGVVVVGGGVTAWLALRAPAPPPAAATLLPVPAPAPAPAPPPPEPDIVAAPADVQEAPEVEDTAEVTADAEAEVEVEVHAEARMPARKAAKTGPVVPAQGSKPPEPPKPPPPKRDSPVTF